MKIEFGGKTYYTIDHVAKAVGVTSRTIKQWENVGHFPKSRRDPIRDWRIYTQEEIQELAQLAKTNNYFRGEADGDRSKR